MKTHGTVEKSQRIDSFTLEEERQYLYDGRHFYSYSLFMDPEGDGIEITDDDMRIRATIMLSEVVSKSRQRFFICPTCGTRTRYLYKTGYYQFKCRGCAGLNYKSQQEYKDCIDYYEEGVEYAKEVFNWDPPSGLVPVEWCAYPLPKRPPYMRETTYLKHLKKYKWYQQKYQEAAEAEAAAIMASIENRAGFRGMR